MITPTFIVHSHEAYETSEHVVVYLRAVYTRPNDGRTVQAGTIQIVVPRDAAQNIYAIGAEFVLALKEYKSNA